MLPNSQVASAPRHLISELQQAGRSTADRALARGRRRSHVGVDAAREVKAQWRRSRDLKGEL
jgi:hypothetical protein